MDWLKCNICFNTYSDSILRPRVLNCGHSFCERCLKNTIHDRILTCPQCRKVHNIDTVVDLPINFIVEGLLKSLNLSSQDVSEGATTGPIEDQCDIKDKSESDDSFKSILEQEKSLSTQKELLKTSAGMCYEHPINELIFRCSTHKCWVCERCTEEKGDHPKQNCTITFFKEEIEDRKQDHKVSIDNEETCCDQTFHVIEKHISFLSDNREHHISLVDILQDLLNLHKNEDINLQSEIKSFEKVIENGKLVKLRLLDIKSIVLQAETLDECNAARDMVENKLANTREWIKNSVQYVEDGKVIVQTSSNLEMASKSSLDYREKFGLLQEKLELTFEKSEQNEILDKIFKSKDIESLSKALKEKQIVYVEKDIQNKTMYAQLSTHDDNLYFHTFREQEVEQGYIPIQYDFLVKLIPPSPSLVFMEICLGSKVKGKAILKLNGYQYLSDNIINIATGKLGNILPGRKLECVQNHIYFHALPYTPLPLTPNIRGNCQAKRGDIVGYYPNGYLQDLYFTTWERFDYKCSKVLGSVVSGFDILKECHSNGGRGVTLNDCGLVLHKEE